MNGAKSLVETLRAAGVDACFANPGTSEMHFVAALDQVPGIQCVLGLQENVVTGMADGYFRIARKPACTLLHCGPGLANGMANLHNARRARSGIVNIVGDQATFHRPFDPPLTADTAGMAQAVSQWVRTSTKSSELGRDAAEAVRAARTFPGQIATLIDSGEFPAGSRLPAERELASLLGVSRTSVREAIISLEIAGRVEVRVGSGIFVAKPGAAQIAGLDDEGPSPFELLAARRLIEGEVAALAARTIKKADIAQLRDTVVRMRDDSDDFTKRDAADREFHVRIAGATGNGSLALAVDGLWQQRRGKLWSRIETYFHTQKIREATLVDHTAIIDALERRDAAGARDAMHKHLARVEREFQRRWDEIVPGATVPNGARRATAQRKRLTTQSM